MITKLRDILLRGRRDQEGGISAEYIAVIVIVAAVIAAVWGIGIQGKVDQCGKEAVTKLFAGGETPESVGCDAAGTE
jgi:Flp pilus assembly pilin Flp